MSRPRAPVILTVAETRPALEALCAAVRAAAPDAALHAFEEGTAALAFAAAHRCDVALLDTADSLALARRLQAQAPRLNLIMVAPRTEEAAAALALHASGCLDRPVTADGLRRELADLRYPPLREGEGRLRVRTFGNFEVYAGDMPLHFRYSKSKELLAYLIDRSGALCTNREITAVLWEDAAAGPRRASYLQNLRSDLTATLRAAGCAAAIVCQRGRMGVRPDSIDCDYYDFLRGDPAALHAYRGEYMSQYSWSEFTLGRLEAERARAPRG